MQQKRGQTTLFIILGIIILLSVVLFAVFREELTIFLPERIIPTRTGAIQRYIDNCVSSVANDGLGLLGAQGGYIWLPAAIESNPLAAIDTGIKIPLWQYQSENRIPSIQLMQDQLSRYVNENLRSCLSGLEDFQKQYDIVEKGDVSATTTIAEENVLFSVTYPIDIMNKEGTKITEIDRFDVEVPVKLKHMHEVAKAIMETEAKEMKLEAVAVDLIALDSSLPLTGTDLSCGRKVWVASQVEQKVKTLLRTNLPSLRVDFTDYEPVPEEQLYVQNHYIWKATDIDYDDVRVGFTLAEWPYFRMDVQPRSGQLLQSSELRGQGLASFVCLQQWKFTYDIDFPVLVRVEDTQQNYRLDFGFVGHVVNNRGNREPLAQAAVLPDLSQAGATDEAYCSNLYGDIFMRVLTFDNVSDPSFGETHLPINKVNITYTCLKYTCAVGESKYVSGGAAAQLDAQFPYCVNGILRAAKPSYKTAQTFVTAGPGKTTNLYLTPLKTVEKYTIVKHVLNDGVLSAARPLDPGEKAFVSLKYVKDKSLVHESWGGYPSESDVPVQSLELLAEADFSYSLEVYIMNNNSMVGGYTAKWTPEWSQLENANALEFHVAAQSGGISDAEIVSFIGKLPDLSKRVPAPVMK